MQPALQNPKKEGSFCQNISLKYRNVVISYERGDVVQIYYYDMYADVYEVAFSGYITTGNSNKKLCKLAYHAGSGNGDIITVNELCSMFSAPYRIVFIDFT